ncbi:serine protease [Cunninghamella echinulata]|nr:serine protease [Cunninghamella echinulata]
MKQIIISTALLLAGFAHSLPTTSTPFIDLKPETELAPLHSSSRSDLIQDSYIVVLKDHLNDIHLQDHALWITNLVKEASPFINWLHPKEDSFGIKHVYDTPSFKGYSGKFDKDMLQAIRTSEDVAYVENDGIAYLTSLERNAPWGISRISQRKTLKINNFNKYYYDETTAGKGVKIYVIDTGINVEHVDFEGRAIWGKNFVLNEPEEDTHGHGSHVGGTAAGKKYGVAKKAQLVAVKAMNKDGQGGISKVIKSLDWVIESHLKDVQQQQQNQTSTSFKGSVINISLGYEFSKSLNAAVNSAVEAGLHVAVAAGNENEPACNGSPSSAELPIIVGASTIDDERASFSNYGKCVDVFSPGHRIESAWIGSKYATLTGSGTSMAAPHVAGLAAYLLSQTDHGMSPKEMKEKIKSLATKDILKNIGEESPNLLIYNGYEHKDQFKSIFKDTFGSDY